MKARRPVRLLALVLMLSAIPSPAAVLSIGNWETSSLFGSFASLDAPQSIVDAFCLGSHSGSYMITFQSANAAGGRFHLASGSAQMAYQVEFAPNGGDFAPVAAGSPLQNVTPVKNCSGSGKAANVAVRLTLDPADFNPAPVGVYSDTLTAILSDF